jgi:cystathionine beta-lyase/cystathionine gamma-synthase
LLVRSLATLELRTRKAADSAARLARFLDGIRAQGGNVERVHYAGLREHPDHDVAREYMDTFGFMLSFEVQGGLSEAVRVYDRFRVIARAVSLGGVETLASLPVHTTHAMMSPEALHEAGIAEGLIRVSVGGGPYESLERDLAQALSK